MATLEILHWNDVHGRYERLARASEMARRIKAESDHPVLLFDGADMEIFVPQIMPELLEAYLVGT